MKIKNHDKEIILNELRNYIKTHKQFKSDDMLVRKHAESCFWIKAYDVLSLFDDKCKLVCEKVKYASIQNSIALLKSGCVTRLFETYKEIWENDPKMKKYDPDGTRYKCVGCDYERCISFFRI